MYILHRLYQIQYHRIEMIEFLKQQILITTEQAVPFLGPLIAELESKMLEGILKTGLHMIF